MSSRLFQRVREELGLVYSVYTFTSFHVDAGVHGVYLATSPEQAREAMTAVNDELARLADDGIPEDELRMGKQQLKGQITLSLEGVSSRMYRAAATELYGEPHRGLDELLARVDAISEEEIRQVCREFFRPDAQTVLSLGPSPAVA
jgi:predicted Zn-dependent peptidase